MWLDKVGGVTVERITDVKRSFAPASKFPAKGVLHTTEGSWPSALSVFRYNTGTPTFMLGRDGTTRSGVGYSGKLRLAQFMPIGEMALTLKNLSGGAETNRDCLVQIELVAFCQWTPWLPDAETTALLAALMRELRDKAGIPLRRAGDGSRSVTRWINNAGWFGHSEVPENDHTDPRAIKWADLFSEDKEEDVIVYQLPEWFAPWKRWYIYQRPNGTPMPTIPGLPSPIPAWAWDDIALTAELIRLTGPPVQYQNWRNGRLLGTPMPESLPVPIPPQWWEGAVRDHAFANAFADKADDPLQAELAQKMQQIVTLQNELASAQAALQEALTNGSSQIAEMQAEADRVKSLLEQALAELS